ncbi:hypothetical protein C1645_838041 [Glomus cerebriforme]|uniref:Uncharacterized protein n=1 Tax=Glomus cerebriforme TaxID=658196 RepID=A0A397S7Q0_9GLOM|nr:hypothetical protein C1645_838041 [Glomus cerebriforme]
MPISLYFAILDHPLKSPFSIVIPEDGIEINGIKHPLDQISFGDLKELIHKFKGSPLLIANGIIIVQLSLPATSAGSFQQGITQVALKPDEIFKNFLRSKHSQFLDTYIKNNDPLPLYDSSRTKDSQRTSPETDVGLHTSLYIINRSLTLSRILKIPVPVTSSNHPSLLLYNLHEPITQISAVQSAITKAKNNLLIFLGTYGCEKMRTCYELLCENWELYFVALRKGNGGSADIEAIEIHLSEKLIQNFEENYQFAENIIFGNLYEYNDDIFLELILQLNVCIPLSVMTCIGEIYQQFQQISSDRKKFIIILDETQVLEDVLRGKFKL